MWGHISVTVQSLRGMPCPACFLLAADTHKGRTTRRYTLVPPTPAKDGYKTGETFTFGLTFFGEETLTFLPHFVLALHETGRTGVGHRAGTFDINQIIAVNPLTQHHQTLYTAGNPVVLIPNNPIAWGDIPSHLPTYQAQLKPQGYSQELTLSFLSPLRLKVDRRLIKTVDFSILFKRLLWRIDELGKRYGDDADRPQESISHLLTLADQVRLVESNTKWQSFKSRSSRTGGETEMSGLMGKAIYAAEDWGELLPYLIWGELIHIGKHTAKGHGVYRQAG